MTTHKLSKWALLKPLENGLCSLLSLPKRKGERKQIHQSQAQPIYLMEDSVVRLYLYDEWKKLGSV